MSIKDHGFRVMELRSLKFDMEDIRARQAKPDVIELAKSRERIALHPITVNAKNKELIAGRDRLAADLLNKVQRAPVRLIEGPDEEMRDVEDEENIRRRHEDRDGLIARYVARKTAKLKEAAPELLDKIPNNSPSPKRGRPKLPETAVREELAAKLDVTTGAIRKAEARSARPAPASVAGAAASPPIALKGKFSTPAFLDKVREVQAAIDVADKAMRSVQGALARLTDLPFARAALQQLQERAHALAADVRAMRPRSLCLGIHGKTPCQLCGGAGWLGSDADTIQEDSGQPTPASHTGNQGGQPASHSPPFNRGVAAGPSNDVRKGAGGALTHAEAKAKATPAPRKIKIVDDKGQPIPLEAPAPAVDDNDEAF